MTNLASHAARGASIVLVAQAIRLVTNMVVLVVLGRLLAPKDFGLLAMVLAIVGVAEIFRDFGLSTAALRAPTLSHRQQSNLFWINSGIGLALTLLVYFSAPLISAFYREDLLTPIVQAISVTFLLNGMTTQFRVRINREMRFFTLTLVELIPILAAALLAIAAAIVTHDYRALVLQQISLALLGLILAASCSKWWPGLPGKAPMLELVNFGMNVAGTQALSYMTRNVDSIGIGRVWGASSLGQYDRAYQLLMLPINQINAPLSKIALPVLAQLTDDEARYTHYIRRSQLVACYLTATLFALIAALAPQLVAIVMGPGWGEAGLILQVLAIGGIFRSIVQVCFWIYMSRGLAKEQFRFYLVSQPLLAGFILAGLPWGPIGVAAAHSIGYALFWVASLWWVGRKANLRTAPLFADAARAILTVGIPAGVVAFFSSKLVTGDLLQVLVGVLGALLWCGLVCLVVPAVRRDAQVLMSFLRKAVGRAG